MLFYVSTSWLGWDLLSKIIRKCDDGHRLNCYIGLHPILLYFTTSWLRLGKINFLIIKQSIARDCDPLFPTKSKIRRSQKYRVAASKNKF